jgi:hypothetical protein
MGGFGYFKRLPPEVRAKILEQLEEHAGDRPVSIAQIVHLLGESRLHVELSETSLKSSIAEAALQKGFDIAFDGT